MKMIKKDITTVETGIIAHGVNCKIVMNSGVARAIRNRWPKVYERYSTLEPSEDLLGTTQIITIIEDRSQPLYVANCFTQTTYGKTGQHANAAAIDKTLFDVASFASIRNVPVYIPQIGCGLGGLCWEQQVKPIIEHNCDLFPEVDVYVCTL